jgi:hypothetical protein
MADIVIRQENYKKFRGVIHAALAPTMSMKMNDSPLLKGTKALRGLGSYLVGIWSGWLTGQPPEAFGFFPPFLRGIFIGVAHAAWGGTTERENVAPSRDRKGAVEAIC